jgi:hypothetical protein
MARLFNKLPNKLLFLPGRELTLGQDSKTRSLGVDGENDDKQSVYFEKCSACGAAGGGENRALKLR